MLRLPMCAYKQHASNTTRSSKMGSQRGALIIELMIGIVVALLVGLAATSSALTYGASQRQSISSTSTMINVSTIMAVLKNDTTNTGLGFFGDSSYLCNTLSLSSGATVLSDAATFVPIRITKEAANDRIDVVYGTRVEAGANVLLSSDSDGTSAQTSSLLPVSVGEAVLLAPEVPGDPCVVRSVTAITASTPTTPQILTFGNAGLHNAAAFALPMTFSARARVALLGNLGWSRYRVQAGNLVLEHPLVATSAVLARNVVGFRVQYGISAVGGTALQAWQDATGADFATLDSANISRVRALRLGVVTRSPQREKANNAGVCTASDSKPTLFGVEVEPNIADWQCFRFRTAIAVVPLRNLVMGVN